MKALFYVLSIVGGMVGAFILFAVMFAADSSAPQQGAGAAVAAALAVIPYCMARAMEKLSQKPLDQAVAKLLIAQAQKDEKQQPKAVSQPAAESFAPHG